MKYIDADKLIAEIDRRLKIVEPHKDTFESAAACRQELIWMKGFITSLQQEQTPTEREISEAHRYAKMIREMDKARIQQEQPEGGCSEKPNDLLREQPEVDLSEETITKEFHIISDRCFNEGVEGWQKEKLIARHFYELGLNARKEE